MLHKMMSGMVAVGFAALVVAGCAGYTGTGEGQSCTGEDQCEGQLVCQFVPGHSGDFCCPTPLVLAGTGGFTSNQGDCQPTNATPAPSSSK
jgi:hypothetical protein